LRIALIFPCGNFREKSRQFALIKISDFDLFFEN